MSGGVGLPPVPMFNHLLLFLGRGKGIHFLKIMFVFFQFLRHRFWRIIFVDNIN